MGLDRSKFRMLRKYNKRNQSGMIKKYMFDSAALLMTFMTPLTGVVAAMTTFLLVDLVTGALKARSVAQKKAKQLGTLNEAEIKQEGRDAIQSRKMSHSVAKFIFYLSGIILAHLTNHFLELDMPLVKMILGFIIVIELKSIDENMKEVLGYSIFSKLLAIVKRKEESNEQ